MRALVGAYVVLYAAANVGSVLAPRLVKQSPELLLAASSRIRHLLFAVPAGISPAAYSAIGFLRLIVAAAVCFLLGRWYGHRGFAWLDRQLGNQRPAALRWLERATDRVGWLFVLLMPGSNIVCALVGHRKMSPRLFFPLVLIGTVLRLWWVWLAANYWESELDTALEWIGRYQWWLIGGFLGITLLQSWRRTRATDRATQPVVTQETPLPDED
jgi:membrane protein DedA with SNARE-associated domain